MTVNGIHPTPWDTKAFAIPCFEITELSDEVLAHAAISPGHYSIKVDPLVDKQLLHQHGFYYTDTLIEPACKPDQLLTHLHPDCTIGTDVSLEELLPMCDDTFLHGRFHRDFNLTHVAADQRYKQWLRHIQQENEVFGLYYRGHLAGFIAHNQGNLLLHAISSDYRGKGLAKFFWSALCQQLFHRGIINIRSSVSAANLPVLNLYASLGFRFNSAVDIYHKLSR